MALKSLIYSPAGKDAKGKKIDASITLNSLKRFALSGILVPKQANAVAKMAAATSLTQPARSQILTLQGPKDASTEVYSLSGAQGVTVQGIGQITTTGGDTNVTGIGTKFTQQLVVGDTISTTNGSGVVLTIVNDTTATTVANMAANTAQNFFILTPVNRTNGETIFVTIDDIAWRRRWMNRDVPAIHVFGSNTKPLFMMESALLEMDQSLALQFLNYDTAGAASFAPLSEGRKWQYEAMKYREVSHYIQGLQDRKQFIQPYWLTLDAGWASIHGTADGLPIITNSTLTCTGDVTLVLFNVYGQAFADRSNDDDLSHQTTVEFRDPKTQRAMQGAPMPLSLCAGTSQNPFRLSSPWIIEPQTQIQATFKNISTGFNSTLSRKAYVTFHGVAIYTGSSWHGSTLTNKHLIDEASKMYAAMSVPQIRPASQQ